MKDIKTSKGKSSAIFKLKEDLVGGKKVEQEQTAMKNHKTKEILFEPEKILEAGLEYVTDLLQNRPPSDECKRQIKILELLHIVRMDEKESSYEKEPLERIEVEEEILKLNKNITVNTNSLLTQVLITEMLCFIYSKEHGKMRRNLTLGEKRI